MSYTIDVLEEYIWELENKLDAIREILDKSNQTTYSLKYAILEILDDD